ncbi:MAG: hypothetical protein U1D30_24185 [Planctomycetota bacterium]
MSTARELSWRGARYGGWMLVLIMGCSRVTSENRSPLADSESEAAARQHYEQDQRRRQELEQQIFTRRNPSPSTPRSVK